MSVLEDDHYKRMPRVTVGVEPSLLNVPSKGQNLQPFMAIVTFQYERKILELDEKPQTKNSPF